MPMLKSALFGVIEAKLMTSWTATDSDKTLDMSISADCTAVKMMASTIYSSIHPKRDTILLSMHLPNIDHF